MELRFGFESSRGVASRIWRAVQASRECVAHKQRKRTHKDSTQKDGTYITYTWHSVTLKMNVLIAECPKTQSVHEQ